MTTVLVSDDMAKAIRLGWVPGSTPAEGEIASRERKADAPQTMDFAKYTPENTQRLQEEQERQRAREKERGEQGRER